MATERGESDGPCDNKARTGLWRGRGQHTSGQGDVRLYGCLWPAYSQLCTRERERAGGGGREYHQDGTVRERARERVKGREREREVGDKIL